MIKWLLDKYLPVKKYAILASEGTGVRGNCYLILVGRLPSMSSPAGMIYEKDADGIPNSKLEECVVIK